MTDVRRIAFLFIGGVHHVFHTMPVACALSRRGQVEVTAFVADADTEATSAAVVGDLGGSVRIERLAQSSLLDWLLGTARTKLWRLWRHRWQLRPFDALVTAECTSIALKRMGVNQPAFICLPHGAGDRAVSFEPRFRQFDRVLVAGSKTARRMAASGVDPDRIRTVGYPKAEYLANRARSGLRPFASERPVVLYNPHFRRQLSSLDQAHEIISAIRDGTDLNLIVAPHIRTFENASRADLARWHALGEPGRVLVDTGSPRMIDMSYVTAADLYLGDVSSQVYEFLLLGPRPCLFVNAHDVAWQRDPDYTFWHLGEVVSPNGVVAGLRQAVARCDAHAAAQQAAVAETFGELEGSAERAANAVLECIAERQ